jgi:putative ABC transport system ATP-binding protein
MNIFETLNHEQNISIVMVTHEPDIGARAKRRIHMKDGLIVRED